VRYYLRPACLVVLPYLLSVSVYDVVRERGQRGEDGRTLRIAAAVVTVCVCARIVPFLGIVPCWTALWLAMSIVSVVRVRQREGVRALARHRLARARGLRRRVQGRI
jgi:hypothetical protein